ncbi:MAG: hypothetical protein ACXWCT_16235, partial [Flavitalea sp.]
MLTPALSTENMTIRENLTDLYSDVYTPEALEALNALAHFNTDIKEVMESRMKRRADRYQQKKRIGFPDPS